MKRLIKNSYIKLFFLGVFFLVCSGCTEKVDKFENCTDADYDNCNTDEPLVGAVVVYVTINDIHNNVIVIIKEGLYESGEIVLTDTLQQNSKTYNFDINTTYSAAAFYKNDNDSVIAIDGGKLEYYTYKACELTCYEVKNLKIDLRLK
ncbi:MAG: hypothetical protein KGZ97_12625 [Bacteroidetes bacterium]|nr:hypothetical protein [Bacteroidota bacterium]